MLHRSHCDRTHTPHLNHPDSGFIVDSDSAFNYGDRDSCSLTGRPPDNPTQENLPRKKEKHYDSR